MGSESEADGTLVARILGGDRDAFGVLVTRHQATLFRVVGRIVGSDADTRDIAQEAFVRAFRNLGRFDTTREFAPWLVRIGRNAALDHLRRRKASPVSSEADLLGGEHDGAVGVSPLDVAAGADDLGDEIASQQERREIERALRDLEPKYREVILLFHFEELRYEEIAEVLGLPLGTVMTRLFRARKKLASTLAHLEANR